MGPGTDFERECFGFLPSQLLYREIEPPRLVSGDADSESISMISLAFGWGSKVNKTCQK